MNWASAAYAVYNEVLDFQPELSIGSLQSSYCKIILSGNSTRFFAMPPYSRPDLVSSLTGLLPQLLCAK